MRSQTFASFCAFGALSSGFNAEPHRASRPYDKLHGGIVLGEGGGTLVLEDMDFTLARGARVYAEILGHGAANDAGMPRRHVTGRAMATAIGAALKESQLEPASIDHINAQGCGLPQSDVCDTNAFKRTFGERAYQIPVSSIKSMIGQPLAAAGVFQTAAACLSIQDQRVPPTINQGERDPLCDLDYVPNTSTSVTVNRCAYQFSGRWRESRRPGNWPLQLGQSDERWRYVQRKHHRSHDRVFSPVPNCRVRSPSSWLVALDTGGAREPRCEPPASRGLAVTEQDGSSLYQCLPCRPLHRPPRRLREHGRRRARGAVLHPGDVKRPSTAALALALGVHSLRERLHERVDLAPVGLDDSQAVSRHVGRRHRQALALLMHDRVAQQSRPSPRRSSRGGGRARGRALAAST